MTLALVLGLLWQAVAPEVAQHAQAGLAAKQQGKLPQAIAEFQKVTELAPSLAAGFVNFARIKGSHNAILSGMLAAETAHQALVAGRAGDELASYEAAWRSSEIGRDLYKVRNVKPLWTKCGLALGVALGGLDMWMNELLGLSPFGTMKHGKPDSAMTVTAAAIDMLCRLIIFPITPPLQLADAVSAGESPSLLAVTT